MDPRFLVTLVRHGETALNVQKLLQGHTDTPLSDVGIKQATLLGKKIASEDKFTKAYSSDLNRAFTTAQIILKTSGHSLDVTKDQRIRERGFGEAEGKPVQNLFDEAAKRNLSIQDYNPPGGEKVIDVMKRAESFFLDLCKQSEEKANGNKEEKVLVVAHGGWIQHLMKTLHRNEKMYQLENFNASKAIRIARNTGVFKFSISTCKNTAATEPKYLISFSMIDDIAHLEIESE